MNLQSYQKNYMYQNQNNVTTVNTNISAKTTTLL